MMLHFPINQIRPLVEHAKNAPEHRAPYEGHSADNPVGLMLVGDQGVYLMSNGAPGFFKFPKEPKKGDQVVVYANEINPITMEFDDWWHNKQECFGGDDNVELISLDDNLERLLAACQKHLIIDLTPPDHTADESGTIAIISG